MLKQQTFNYITLSLALVTIVMTVYTVRNDNNKIPCLVMLAITVGFHFISKHFNEEAMQLKKSERDALRKNEIIPKEEAAVKQKEK